MIRALIAVFVSGFAVMVSEMVAGRLVAPFFGQSIHTWTALTGVTLLGCTLGNFIGAVASRRSPRVVSVAAFLLGGLSIVSVPIVLPIVAHLGLLSAVTISWLPPSVLLGCVTPSAAAAVVRSERNGTDLSWLYAFSMTGSLIGAGLGGLCLPFVFPADTLYYVLGGILVLSSILVCAFSKPRNSPVSVSPEHAAVLMPRLRLGVSVFAVGYLGMAVEMAASKLVIPILGGNHVVWAFIIVSFIGWMAFGGVFGGRVADRFPRMSLVVLSLCLASLGISATSILETRFFTLPVFDEFDVFPRLFLQVVLGFLPAALTLGVANTVLLKFATARALSSGDRAAPGLFYALSSAGCVAGTFVTGLWCTGIVPGHVLMGALSVAIAVVAVAFVWENRELRFVALFVLVVVLAVSSLLRRSVPVNIVLSGERMLFSRESNYNVVNVTFEPDYPGRRTIWLDRIAHTSIDQSHPEHLSSAYTAIIDAILSAPRMNHDSIFMIGGGGYALPMKWASERNPPRKVVVAEIDPVVKNAAFDCLKPKDLKYPPGWQFPVGDGRAIAEGLEKGAYDVVIGDTISDVAIPYHLVTSEFTAKLKSLLKKDGVYILHALDVPESQTFVKVLAATLLRSFAHVGSVHYNGLMDSRQSMVLVATDDPAKCDLNAFAAALKRTRPNSFPHTVDYSASPDDFVLTDRFAPVERWLLQTISEADEMRSLRYARQAVEARAADDMERCREMAIRALDCDPDNPLALDALFDWLQIHPNDEAAAKRLEHAASRENHDPFARTVWKRFCKEQGRKQ